MLNKISNSNWTKIILKDTYNKKLFALKMTNRTSTHKTQIIILKSTIRCMQTIILHNALFSYEMF